MVYNICLFFLHFTDIERHFTFLVLLPLRRCHIEILKMLSQKIPILTILRIFSPCSFVCCSRTYSYLLGGKREPLSPVEWQKRAHVSLLYSLIGALYTYVSVCARLTEDALLCGVLQKILSISWQQRAHTLAASAIVQACSPLIEDLGGWLVYGWLSSTQRSESPAREYHHNYQFQQCILICPLGVCPSLFLPMMRKFLFILLNLC